MTFIIGINNPIHHLNLKLIVPVHFCKSKFSSYTYHQLQMYFHNENLRYLLNVFILYAEEEINGLAFRNLTDADLEDMGFKLRPRKDILKVMSSLV